MTWRLCYKSRVDILAFLAETFIKSELVCLMWDTLPLCLLCCVATAKEWKVSCSWLSWCGLKVSFYPKKLSTRSRLLASSPAQVSVTGMVLILYCLPGSWQSSVCEYWDHLGKLVCCVVLAPCKYRVTWCQVYGLVRITETFIHRQDPELRSADLVIITKKYLNRRLYAS